MLSKVIGAHIAMETAFNRGHSEKSMLKVSPYFPQIFPNFPSHISFVVSSKTILC